MPLYYFSCEGAQTFVDEVGTELPDLATARVQAVENAAEIMRDDPGSFAMSQGWRMTVREGATIRFRLSIHLEDAIEGVGVADAR